MGKCSLLCVFCFADGLLSDRLVWCSVRGAVSFIALVCGGRIGCVLLLHVVGSRAIGLVGCAVFGGRIGMVLAIAVLITFGCPW